MRGGGMAHFAYNGQRLRQGDHLRASRIVYTHEGLYVGGGRVIHYSGLADGFRSGPVEETSLESFASGSRIEVVEHPRRVHSPRQSVQRARERLGEAEYSVVWNNCEHFVNWCIDGTAESRQVKRGFFAAGVALAIAVLVGVDRARA